MVNFTVRNVERSGGMQVWSNVAIVNVTYGPTMYLIVGKSGSVNNWNKYESTMYQIEVQFRPNQQQHRHRNVVTNQTTFSNQISAPTQ